MLIKVDGQALGYFQPPKLNVAVSHRHPKFA
jgi:hypothetical protein